ncbi:hypothetical protein DRN72_01845 [Methanosarcinales archaeon]|nr:MAG: hypothetical protein DRN72_01845 [Methanosarcinales archaeon]
MIVVCDISGRHAIDGHYLMVCSVVVCEVEPTYVAKVLYINISSTTSKEPTLRNISDFLRESISSLPNAYGGLDIVIERGELFGIDE